jgi:hypothetical protein
MACCSLSNLDIFIDFIFKENNVPEALSATVNRCKQGLGDID